MSHQQIITHQIASQLQDITLVLNRQSSHYKNSASPNTHSGNDR